MTDNMAWAEAFEQYKKDNPGTEVAAEGFLAGWIAALELITERRRG